VIRSWDDNDKQNGKTIAGTHITYVLQGGSLRGSLRGRSLRGRSLLTSGVLLGFPRHVAGVPV